MYGPELTKTVTNVIKKRCHKKVKKLKVKARKINKKNSLEAVRNRSKFCAGKKYGSYKTSRRFEHRATPEIMLPLIVPCIFNQIERITNGTELM